MTNTSLKIILLTHGADDAIVKSLAEVDGAKLVGIFIETETVRQYGWREKLRRSIRYDGYLNTLAKFARKLFSHGTAIKGGENSMQQSRERLVEIADKYGVPVHFVDNYHSEMSISLMRSSNSDLGVIYGTNILKESVFKIPRLGSINLHQARVPYYRGGPPVFWELFNDEREVGITVHFVEPKVDTGEVIVQTTVPLNYDYSYGLDYDSFIADFRSRMMALCPQLVAEAVRQIAEGTARTWKQNLELGHRYRLPTRKEKDELVRRLKQRRKQVPVVIPDRVSQRGD